MLTTVILEFYMFNKIKHFCYYNNLFEINYRFLKDLSRLLKWKEFFKKDFVSEWQRVCSEDFDISSFNCQNKYKTFKKDTVSVVLKKYLNFYLKYI